MSKRPAKPARKTAPKRPTRSKPARKPARCSCLLCRALTAPAKPLPGLTLGQVHTIEYTHANGQRYRHTFKTPAKLYAIDHGRALVINATKLVRVGGEHFIGD